MSFAAQHSKLLFLLILLPVIALADKKDVSKEDRPVDYRGWTYLVQKLKEDKVPEETIHKIYANKRIERFQEVTFNVPPKESRQLYKDFDRPSNIKAARHYLRTYRSTFQQAEEKFKVSPYPIASIILVETHLGKNTGNHPIIYRLSRLANIADPQNVEQNFIRLKKTNPELSREEVVARGEKLHTVFYPEILAAIEIAQRNSIDIFGIKGSSAGAFGIPQFLPSSYLRYGVDGNNDGKVSLYNIQDAIHSVGNYLKNFGWKENATEEEKKKVIWHYNHSEPYVDTVYSISETLRN